MSLEGRFSNQLVTSNENWRGERRLSTRSLTGSAVQTLRSSAVKAVISLILLISVFAFVGYYYDTSRILQDLRSLSVGALGIISIALLANAFAADFRFKIVATEIEHPISF